MLASDLRKGDTKSCGCYRKEKLSEIFVKDLTGLVFGRLTVIKRSDNIIGGNERNSVSWLCRCICGNEVILKSFSLNTKRPTLSCGCLIIDTLEERNNNETKKLEEMLIGKQVGRLFVIKRDGYTVSNEKTGKKSSLFLCECECGNTVLAIGTRLKIGNITSCGCKSESKTAIFLKKYFKKNFETILEYSKFKNPRTGKSLYFDIYLPKEKVFIEINGKQHYEWNGHFHKTEDDFDKARERDKIKKKYAKANGLFIEVDLRKNISDDDILKDILMRIKNYAK